MNIDTKLRRFYKFFRTYGVRRLFKRTTGVLLESIPAKRLGHDSTLLKNYLTHHTGRPPIVLLAGIEWSYRLQRAQQLAKAFASLGSAVMYCEPVCAASHEQGWCFSMRKEEHPIGSIKFMLPRRREIWSPDFPTPYARLLKESFASFINEIRQHCTEQPLLIVQSPFWLHALPEINDVAVIYDCVDEHSDFSDNDTLQSKEYEYALAKQVSGIISTSETLDLKWKSISKSHCIIRNGVDFEHFHNRPRKIYSSRWSKGIIGYHGAVEDWFDIDLVEDIASSFREYEILIIGGIGNPEARKRLSAYPNVRMTGEVPYEKLPYYLHAFSAAIIPFKIRPLTVATNPIKAYEYMATGIPVVTTPMPEMASFGEFVTISEAEGFITALRNVLQRKSVGATRMHAYAKQNSWKSRAEAIYDFSKIVALNYNTR